MSELKIRMSDVFELPLHHDGNNLKDKCGVGTTLHVAKFADLSSVVYAEHAINSHDQLVDTITEQEKVISELVEFINKLVKDEGVHYEEKDEAIAIIAKHKQSKGE